MVKDGWKSIDPRKLGVEMTRGAQIRWRDVLIVKIYLNGGTLKGLCVFDNTRERESCSGPGLGRGAGRRFLSTGRNGA